MKIPFVSVIIANYNGEKYLDICLTSILKSTYKNFEVIVVDDGSNDRSKEIIEKFCKKDKRIYGIENEKNSGASFSRNKGIKKSRGELLVFLDNDTEVERNWLQVFVNAYRKNKADAWQSKLMEYTDRKKIQAVGLNLIPYTGLSMLIDNSLYKEELPIIGLSAALAVKRKAVLTIRGFDEKIVYHTEDIDFCWRLWIAGFRVITCPKSIVYHWTKPISRRVNTRTTYEKFYFNLCKNSIRSIIKNYQAFNCLKYLLWTLIINFMGAVVILIKRGDLSALRGVSKGILWNIAYLFDSLQQRNETQASRKYSDKIILSLIGAKGSPIKIYKKYL